MKAFCQDLVETPSSMNAGPCCSFAQVRHAIKQVHVRMALSTSHVPTSSASRIHPLWAVRTSRLKSFKLRGTLASTPRKQPKTWLRLRFPLNCHNHGIWMFQMHVDAFGCFNLMSFLKQDAAQEPECSHVC